MARVLPLVGSLLLAGCALEMRPPELASVTPEWGWNGETTDIVVEGRNFFPGVYVDREAGASQVDGDFRVYLETDPPELLDGITLLAYDRLGAEVPVGLPPGLYDLRVVSPSGGEAVLPAAFEVRDTRFDRFQLAVSRGGYEVGEYADLDVRVLDPDGGIATEPLAIEVVATSARGAEGVVFEGEGLADEVPLDGEVGVTGTLDGSATLRVTSTVEDDVTFTVSAVDDPTIDPAALVLTWDPGPIDHLEVDLLDEDGVVTAGDLVDVDIRPYDASGALIEGGYPLEVALSLPASCGAPEPEVVDLSDPGPYPVRFATSCEDAVLTVQAFGVATARSAPFRVIAGPAVGYAVRVFPSTVAVGSSLSVEVTAVDTWDNPVPGYALSEPLALCDNLGGVDSVTGVGDVSCYSFDQYGVAACFADPIRAGSAVVLTASGNDGLFGSSAPFVVEPGPATDLLVEVGEATVRAGDTLPVRLELRDDWGNPWEVDPEGDPIRIEDDTGTLSCTWAADPLVYDCSITAATPATVISATVRGVTGVAAGPLAVTNAALASAEVEPSDVPGEAGASFPLTVRGWDAYGNAYVSPVSGLTVDLDDSTGTLSPDTATFSVAGEAVVAATVTRAAEDVVITASQGGVVLGSSDPFVIHPGPLDGLLVEVPPWVEVGGEEVVTVRAVDAWDNVVPEYARPVSLTAEGGLCAPSTLGAFADGVARAVVDCATAGLQERLNALDPDGVSGRSGPFDVVDLGCASPPAATLAVDGDVEAVVCLTGDSVGVSADASGSTGGLYHYVDSDGTAFRALSTSQSFVYDSPGVRRVELLAVDAQACGALAEAWVYVARADGSPAGPLSVSVADATVATGDTTVVSVSATTCTGDVAAGGALWVWADLGTPDGTPSGAGRVLTLDGAGQASFDWTFDAGFAADATVLLGGLEAQAYGSGGIQVTGDRERPYVVSASPAGEAGATVDEVRVGLSEPLLSASVAVSTVSVIGPFGAIPGSVSLSEDARTVVFVPDEPIEPADDVWRVWLSASVRDAAGNRLSGDWSGSAADWSGYFGAVPSAVPSGLDCVVDREAFTPDGDDGVGTEADAVTLIPTADAPPSWWRLAVADTAGTTVRTRVVPGTDASVAWDGRGDDGRVVAGGAWRLALYAVDADGNEGEACSVDIELIRRVETP